MILPSVVRVFFAIDLPEEIKDQVGQYISQLKKQSRCKAIRWSRPENLHVTLQFVGEVSADHIPTLLDKVRHRIEGAIKKSSIAFGQIELFPTTYRPRVIVLDVLPQDELAEISSMIGEGVKASSYEVDKRPFRAHLTLGRIKNPQGVDLAFLEEVERLQLEKMELAEIVLFRSEPQEDGSRYTPIERLVI